MTIDQARWDLAVISAYVPVPDDEYWKECPLCGARPRVWIFDNGRHAKCLCSHKYDPSMVEAESVVSVYRRTGRTEEYDCDALRKAWNIDAASRATP